MPAHQDRANEAERQVEDLVNRYDEEIRADAQAAWDDALTGECYLMFVVPWQWDSRTGECNFLGSWDNANRGTQSFRYDGDGIFRALDDICDRDLADADQDDLLQVWVTLNGAYRYDTAAGGTNEIPDFIIRRATVVAKACGLGGLGCATTTQTDTWPLPPGQGPHAGP